MHAQIKIRMENDAFVDSPGQELARILREIADRVENGADSFPVLDINGNKVGTFQVS